jgi:hypothetical protein
MNAVDWRRKAVLAVASVVEIMLEREAGDAATFGRLMTLAVSPSKQLCACAPEAASDKTTKEPAKVPRNRQRLIDLQNRSP